MGTKIVIRRFDQVFGGIFEIYFNFYTILYTVCTEGLMIFCS